MQFVPDPPYCSPLPENSMSQALVTKFPDVVGGALF